MIVDYCKNKKIFKKHADFINLIRLSFYNIYKTFYTKLLLNKFELNHIFFK